MNTTNTQQCKLQQKKKPFSEFVVKELNQCLFTSLNTTNDVIVFFWQYYSAIESMQWHKHRKNIQWHLPLNDFVSASLVILIFVTWNWIHHAFDLVLFIYAHKIINTTWKFVGYSHITSEKFTLDKKKII